MIFKGFETPQQNWFKMPNCWTDITAGIDNLAELKVVEYVLRHTWGYSEYGEMKRITIDEFVNGRKRSDGSRLDRGTGLSERSVYEGLKKADEHGYLIVESDESDRARIRKSYCLRLLDVPHAEGCRVCTPEVQSLHPYPAESAPRTEKDTSRKTPKTPGGVFSGGGKQETKATPAKAPGGFFEPEVAIETAPADIEAAAIAKRLIDAYGIHASGTITAWAVPIKKFLLANEHRRDFVEAVLDWYVSNWSSYKYMPLVRSAKAFVEKFDQIAGHYKPPGEGAAKATIPRNKMALGVQLDHYRDEDGNVNLKDVAAVVWMKRKNKPGVTGMTKAAEDEILKELAELGVK